MLEPAVMLAKRRRVMLTVSKGASPDQGSRDLSHHLTTSSAQSAVSADQAASSDEGPPEFSSASRGARSMTGKAVAVSMGGGAVAAGGGLEAAGGGAPGMVCESGVEGVPGHLSASRGRDWVWVRV